MLKKTDKCNALILAAGRSGRMGFPKYLLQFDGEKTFLEHIVDQYRAFGCSEIKVVLNDEESKTFSEKELWPGSRVSFLLQTLIPNGSVFILFNWG